MYVSRITVGCDEMYFESGCEDWVKPAIGDVLKQGEDVFNTKLTVHKLKSTETDLDPESYPYKVIDRASKCKKVKRLDKKGIHVVVIASNYDDEGVYEVYRLKEVEKITMAELSVVADYLYAKFFPNNMPSYIKDGIDKGEITLDI